MAENDQNQDQPDLQSVGKGKWVIAEDWDDPNRCGAGDGQCRYLAVIGSDYCPRHGGNKALQVAKQKDLENYRLTKWNIRATEMANSGEIKSLREEVALNRLLVENLLNSAETTAELIALSPQISALLVVQQNLIKAWHGLEEALGLRLSVEEIEQLADTLSRIAGKLIADIFEQKLTSKEEALERLGDQFVAALVRMDET